MFVCFLCIFEAVIYYTKKYFTWATQIIYAITALLQFDGVSSPWEHVCDEHALIQWHVRRCLWSLQHHIQSQSCFELNTRYFLLVFKTLFFLHVYSYFFALILFFTHDSVIERFLLIWSPGEAVCRGFTMGKSLDWPFECFKQNPFLFVLVSEGKTRLVKTFNYLWVLKMNKKEITHPNRNKSIIL